MYGKIKFWVLRPFISQFKLFLYDFGRFYPDEFHLSYVYPQIIVFIRCSGYQLLKMLPGIMLAVMFRGISLDYCPVSIPVIDTDWTLD